MKMSIEEDRRKVMQNLRQEKDYTALTRKIRLPCLVLAFQGPERFKLMAGKRLKVFVESHSFGSSESKQ